MHPLLQEQDRLYHEATELLQKILFPVLNNFGDVIVGGSYVYRLLSYADIDIDIVSDTVSDEIYNGLCNKILSLEGVSEFKSLNRTDRSVTSPRPKGYWLSPKIQYGKNLWNIDIWFQKPEWYTGNTLLYKDTLQAISDEKRVAILTLKNVLRENNIYGVGKEFQSVDIYDAILSNDIQTIEELREYKIKNTSRRES